ncbi:LCP family protein [Actinokineospora sp. UTMC 2448]|uniref:LCP family protein n=1 Tax=Actinokineospora sp. UTMC 2448 TaxID=2268449 RepID=UPI002164DDD2|nr:LCP family protein [Actinokineospora sp. UTMC 2448]UVS81775.1 Putative transcriptional regulator YvhJ [Actinokineospora sp. UTMC 2448]
MDERAQEAWLRGGRALVRSVAALASVSVLAAAAYGWVTFGDVDADTVTTDVIPVEVAESGPEPLDGAVDLLLVGIDSRTDAYGNPLPREVLDMLNAGEAEGERNTDTMILVHIPVDGRRAVAFSFPRDSWVDIGEGFGKARLNSAFAHAYNDTRATLLDEGVDEPDELDRRATVAGRKNLIAAIERLVGPELTIERYAEVNLASFYEVTKAIGGVEVCLNEPVDDWRSGARFRAGRQTISGREALAFVRQRYGLPNGDLDRIVRQQVFLGALADKVLSAEMLTSPTKARELISAVQRSVVLSNGWNLSRFAAQMSGLVSGNIEFHTIPTQGDATIGGAAVLQVDPDEVRAYVEQVTGVVDQAATGTVSPTTTSTTGASTTAPTTTAVEDITVEVRNASNTIGLAGDVLKALTALGYLPGGVGDERVQSGSVIRHAEDEQDKARTVAASLGGDFTFVADASVATGHVRVVLGTSFQTSGLGGREILRMQPPTAPTRPTVAAGSVPCVN